MLNYEGHGGSEGEQGGKGEPRRVKEHRWAPDPSLAAVLGGPKV